MTKVKLKNEVFFFTGVCVIASRNSHAKRKMVSGYMLFFLCLENLLFSSPIHFSRELTFIWKGLLSYRYVWENYNKFWVLSIQDFIQSNKSFIFELKEFLKVTTPWSIIWRKNPPSCPNCKTFILTIFFQALNELFYHFFFLF